MCWEGKKKKCQAAYEPDAFGLKQVSCESGKSARQQRLDGCVGCRCVSSNCVNMYVYMYIFKNIYLDICRQIKDGKMEKKSCMRRPVQTFSPVVYVYRRMCFFGIVRFVPLLLHHLITPNCPRGSIKKKFTKFDFGEVANQVATQPRGGKMPR